MKYALVNPRWTFEGSTYFGCRDPHFPLELLSAREMLRAAGHEVLLVDALMEGLAPEQFAERLDRFKEDFQTRIDLWNEESIELLARAHCVSFECGIESITDESRDAMNKNCRITTDRITERLIYARRRIPWVQANLIKVPEDDPQLVAAWQENLKSHGVGVSEPVPMFPFPGSPEYVTTFSSSSTGS